MYNNIDMSQDLCCELSNEITQSVIYGYNQVGEFHEIFGHPLNKTLQENIFNTNKRLVDFRYSLIYEEYNELINAFEKKDAIECIDAIMDLLYVTYGTYHAFGIDIYKQNFFKINKESEISLELKILKEYVSDFKNACDEQNFSLIQSELRNIITQCYFLADLFKVSVDLCFNEVHRSNLTKVCDTEELAKESVLWYKQNETRYKEPDYRKSANPKYWIVYDKSTSKILKSIKFELPNLKQYFLHNIL